MEGLTDDIRNGKEGKRGLLSDQDGEFRHVILFTPLPRFHDIEFSVRNKHMLRVVKTS